MLNIFKIAAKESFRFKTVRGDVTAEQLFGMRLKSEDGYDLDRVACGIRNDLWESEGRTFLGKSETWKHPLQLKLELVLEVIKDREKEKKEWDRLSAMSPEYLAGRTKPAPF